MLVCTLRVGVSMFVQCTILIDQVMWTRAVEEAITAVQSGADPAAIRAFMTFSQKQLESMVGLVRSDLTKLQRKYVAKALGPSIVAPFPSVPTPSYRPA